MCFGSRVSNLSPESIKLEKMKRFEYDTQRVVLKRSVKNTADIGLKRLSTKTILFVKDI